MSGDVMLDPFAYWSRAMAGWRTIGATAARAEQTATDSRAVIASRSATIGDAMRSPWTADTAELSRMMPEKVAAFSQAGVVFANAWWKMQADYAAEVQHVVAVMLRPMTPLDMGEMSSASAAFALRQFEANVRLGRDMLQPVYRSAANNARRLRKSGARRNAG